MPTIKLQREKCIGCGTCWALCDKFFEAGDNNKSNLKNPLNSEELKVEEIGCAKEAVDTCPVQCITINN